MLPPPSGVSTHPGQGVMAENLQSASSPQREDYGADLINAPIEYTSGQWAGRSIRMQLEEIQQPLLGRKYGQKDFRPLDPPPVVVLRIFEVVDQGDGTTAENELSYESVQAHAFVCTADLFVAPAEDGSISPVAPSASYSRSSRQRTLFGGDASGPIPELAGNWAVQPHVIPWQGETLIMFIFSHLAVKIEGRFRLRYRVADLESRTAGTPPNVSLIQASVHGGPFKVYSTKEVPHLPPSTELTRHLSVYGVKIAFRAHERKGRPRRKHSESEAEDDFE